MKRMILGLAGAALLATLVSWLVPAAAGAGGNLNHNETLVR